MYTIDDKVRAWAEIDLSALKHNLEYAKKRIGRKVICVLKANAYGHGAVECGRYLQSCGADMFAVAALTEAVELRENGITIPILILGYTPPEYAEVLSDLDIEQTAVDEPYAIELNEYAKKAGKMVKIHIKLDTGMSRAGIYAQANHEAAIDAAERVYRLSNLRTVGMYTHFAAADDPAQRDYTKFQYTNYSIVYNGLAERGIRIENCHVSNSAAILNSPIHFDSVREGVMLYGMYPNSLPVSQGQNNEYDSVREGVMLYGMYPDSRPQHGVLKPAMTLKARVTQIRNLPKGTTVSYGRTYTAERDIKSAVVSIGYADGYPRRLSNNALVYINGKAYPQIGRICMDVCMVDVTDGDVHVGDEAILFGDGGMSIEEVSQIVGTINYELTCLVTDRAKRIYIKEE